MAPLSKLLGISPSLPDLIPGPGRANPQAPPDKRAVTALEGPH